MAMLVLGAQPHMLKPTTFRERSGSVVECLTRDRGATGSSFTGVTALCPCRLAPVLKTIFHQCVISYTCSQSYSDGSVLWTGSTGIIKYEVVPVYIQVFQI